jgi:hypothetical protein
MAKIVNINTHRDYVPNDSWLSKIQDSNLGAIKDRKALVNQLCWGTSVSGMDGIKESIPSPVTNRHENSRLILEKWLQIHRMNFVVRNNLEQHVNLVDNGIVIGKLYWDFSYIFHDSFKEWTKLLNKFSLKLPSVTEFDESSSYMPWDNLIEKRVNLMKLLWFNDEQLLSSKVWTDNIATSDMSDNIDIKKLVSRYLWTFSSIFKLKSEPFQNVIYFYWTWNCVYWDTRDAIWLFCPVRISK